MLPVKPLAALVAAVVLLLAAPGLASAQSAASPAAGPAGTPPQTLVLAGPSGTIGSSTAGFSFESSQTGSTFTCSLDGRTPTPCSSPQYLHGLTNGQHTFQAWATGPTGQQDPTGITWTFTVQVPAPQTLALSGPTGTIDTGSARFHFTSNQRSSTFQCSLDGQTPTPCTSPQTISNLTNGQHTFQAWATGPTGQPDPTGITWTFTVQVAPSLVSPPSLSSYVARVGQPVTCQAGTWSGQPAVSYRWYRDGAPVTGPQSSGTYTPQRADAGHELGCHVLAANDGGSREVSAGAVQVEQFLLLANLTFPAKLPATHRRGPLPTLTFLSSNNGHVQVSLVACTGGCGSHRARVVAGKAFAFTTGVNRLRLPPAWQHKLKAGVYQLTLRASTPFGGQQSSVELNVGSAGVSPVPVGLAAGSPGQLPRGASWALNADQRAFALRLAQDTGLNATVAAAWVASEEPASASRAPNGANNWLNIGCFDAGHWVGGGAAAWRTPTGGADATSAWLHGESLPGIGYAARAIVDIIHAAGLPAAEQVQAIQRSPWASSHYPNLGLTYRELQG